jgi:hypothetical protein
MRKLRNLLAVTLLVVPAAALAQTTPTTTAPVTTLTATDFLIALWADPTGNGDVALLSTYEAERFFNTARCECESPLRIRVGFTTAGASKRSTITTGQYKVIIGKADCVSDNAAARSTAVCTKLAEGKLVDVSQKGFVDIETNTGYFFKNISTGCLGTKRLENIRLWIDVNQDDIPDLADASAPSFPVQLDTDPPAQPTGVTVRGGNEALGLSWTSLGGLDDFQGYIVMCSRGEDLAVFEDSGFSNQFMTRDTKCGSAAKGIDTTRPQEANKALSDPGLLAQTIDTTDDSGKGPFVGPKHFEDLDPDFLCSRLITTGTSARIHGLQNGIPYLVGVGAVDRSGNVSPIRNVYLQSPLATRDFYTGYREAGGEAEGGFCNMGGGRGRSAGIWIAALAVIGGLLFRRRLARSTRQR